MKYFSLTTVLLLAFFAVWCTRPQPAPQPDTEPQPQPVVQEEEQQQQEETDKVDEPVIQEGPNREQTAQGNTLVLNNFDDRSVLTSPMKITGAVPSAWVFEGIFPVEIRTDSGELVKEWYAEANIFDEEGEIIDGLVPFTLNLDFTVPTPERAETGVLRLMADNTVDLPEEERDMVDIMVLFE